MPKWFVARDVTNTKEFPTFEEAIEWAKTVEAAGNGEIMFEKSNGIWKVYW